MRPSGEIESPHPYLETEMKHILPTFAVLLLSLLDPLSADDSPAALEHQWVVLNDAGKLEYKTTPKGDRIVDFSYAGYMGGGVAIPRLPVKKEVAPSGGDDAEAIQAAVDEVAKLASSNGVRGAVLLKPDAFRCSKAITLSQNGVVLRGSGSGDEGTRIEMTGDPHTAIVIEGRDLSFSQETSADTTFITDTYVPAGAITISVAEVKNLAPGDAIRIRWARTTAWIRFMDMDQLVRKRKGQPDRPQTWMKAGSEMTIHRIVRAIDGNRITLDVPLTDAIAGELLDRPAVVIKTPHVDRLSQCGIEALQITSPPHRGTLTAGKNVSIVLRGHSEDCWVRDVVMRETLNNVQVAEGCRRITISEAHSYHDSTVEKGAGYPADISIRGSQVLVERCTSHGLGGFYVATLNAAAMLNVVLNCTFEGTGSIQPQMHWSTGFLVDSCSIPEGRVDLINRHSSGSGHGWAIGWGIVWNGAVKHLQVQQPPGALNLAIGCRGEPYKTSNSNAFFSANQSVLPASLYLAQLRERLGDTAVKNIGY